MRLENKLQFIAYSCKKNKIFSFMQPSQLFRHLLVSRDGYISGLNFDRMEEDTATSSLVVPGSIRVDDSSL